MFFIKNFSPLNSTHTQARIDIVVIVLLFIKILSFHSSFYLYYYGTNTLLFIYNRNEWKSGVFATSARMTFWQRCFIIEISGRILIKIRFLITRSV